MIGSSVGAVIRMIATGGRKQPATSRNRLIQSITSQRFISSSAIDMASVWVMNRVDIM